MLEVFIHDPFMGGVLVDNKKPVIRLTNNIGIKYLSDDSGFGKRSGPP